MHAGEYVYVLLYVEALHWISCSEHNIPLRSGRDEGILYRPEGRRPAEMPWNILADAAC